MGLVHIAVNTACETGKARRKAAQLFRVQPAGIHLSLIHIWGEVLGLCGLVGSGRSELVNAVFGKLPLSSGSFLLEGKPYLPQDPRRAIRSGIGLVTEDRKADGLVGLLSIGENLTLSSMEKLTNHFGIFHKEKEKQACGRYFDKLRIKANSMDVRVQALSGGNQQKVVLGRCLMAHPRLLILDEPTRCV